MFAPYLLSFLTFFTPLFFWTLTPNLFSPAKDLVFVVVVLVLLVDFVHRLLRRGTLIIYHSPLTLPLVVFLLTVVTSLVFNPEGRPEALSGKGLMLILLPLLSLLISLSPDLPRLKRIITTAILAATSVLSLHSLLSLSFLSRSAFVPAFMQTVGFTPTGSYLTTLALILIGFTLAVSLLKQTSPRVKNTAAGLLVLHTIAVVAIVSLMLPGGSLSPALLPYGASWSIALDALKSLRSLFFGIGLSNYSLLYSTVKPLSLNLTPFWNILPTSATSELLTLLPTAGILTTLSFLFLLTKGIIWTKGHVFDLAFIFTGLAFILIPATLPLYLLFFFFLALSAPRQSSELILSKGATRLLTVVILGCGLSLALVAGRSYASELFMRRAQLALGAGDSQRSYDLHLQAVRLSPNITNYHLSFAEINFRLAGALSQKNELTDADRETITRLIQQSILSNKKALELRPNSSLGWISLAKIYQNLINVAQDSDRFALDYYSKAISLDRANPLLRLEYGNLLSQLAITKTGAADKAALRGRAKAEFQTAIQLKSDYASAYFNLAKLYESETDYPSAVLAMTQAVKYLDPSGTDYAQASTELDNLKTKLPPQSPTPTPPPTDSSSELTPPSPLPSPLPGGPVEL